MTRSIRRYTILESGLLGMGFVLPAVWAGAFLDGTVSCRLALREFDQAPAGLKEVSPPLELTAREVDFRLWSEKRVWAYRQSLSAIKNSPMAVIRIETANIRAPVFEGTDELALNRGVGWIAGTARPGEMGNIGIAGHRDGFFRRLKDVSPGDAIELSTIRETAVYTVDQIQIVTPDNVGVLRPGAAPTLTLVTCYPFYFIGAAPKRYILHASLRERADHSKTRGEKEK